MNLLEYYAETDEIYAYLDALLKEQAKIFNSENLNESRLS